MTESPKLDAVGLLAGPIAHDLGSALQSVSNNLEFLAEAFRDLLPYVTLEGGDMEVSSELTYLAHEIPPSIDGAQQALAGAARMVAALREISAPSTDKTTEFDVNRGLRSALTMAGTRLRHTARIHAELGDVPAIVGRATDLKQAFVHLLIHVAEHLETDPRSTLGSIRVWTELRNEAVLVGFQHEGPRPHPGSWASGSGGSDGSKYEPGLAVAEAVAQRHGGSLTVDAPEGLGTRVVLRLPQKSVPTPKSAESTSMRFTS